MAELSTIARPYAEALFKVARESGQRLDDWLTLIETLAAGAASPQVAQVVSDPNLAEDKLFDLLAGLVRNPLPEAAARFLKLLIENKRLAALPEVAVQFRQLKNTSEGAADCLVESAFALTEAQVSELVATLSSKFGARLIPTVRTNPELIGGVRVVVGDQVLDSSVRAQLNQMQAALTA
jgi:F-type H+-transporting ATPase subunit delta